MKQHIHLTLLFVFCAVLLIPFGQAIAASHRNVLLLIGDDHGLDAGCYGNRVIKTPNLDRLAAAGVRFSHAFATVSSCSPSRAVILTGLFVHTNGQYGLAHAEHKQSTHANVRSLPRLLRENGYRTGVIGKLHVIPPEVYPFEQQFPGGRNVYEIAEKARGFFAAKDDRPFFLLIGYTDPHRAGRGFANEQNYRNVQKISYDPNDVIVPPYLPDLPAVRRDIADYYESVSRLDQGIGFVLKALEETGKANETLVIYLSDNGTPFPGAKTNLYDAGIHLPLIIRSPAQTQRGIVNRAMVSWVDIMPTILDWAGIKPPADLPGRSVLPILEQESPPGWDTIFASHVFHEITMYYPMRAVRTRRHKLIWNLAHPLSYPFASDLWSSPTWQTILHGGLKMMGQRATDAYIHRPEYELYDLEKDPHELSNVADDPAYAPVLSDLKARLQKMMTETKDPWVKRWR
ncbi:MAG: sulfatase [Abditibacteriales bacterium]|nr:sulfatase [Abditibacteriales bacterium]MDW8366349.1 sulfatase [Abditibacteriales bacterium]